MSDSTSIDSHLYAFNGQWYFASGTPDVKILTEEPAGVMIVDDPSKYSVTLKLCDGITLTKTDLDVPQSRESAVDIQNRAVVTLVGKFGTTGDQVGYQIFSVKGGSTAKLIGTLRGEGHRLNADILVDMWSDQCFGGSVVDLSQLKHESGRKIKVVKRYGASTIHGDCQVLVIPSIEETIYWWAKWIVRKVMRIPLGAKGPSWI